MSPPPIGKGESPAAASYPREQVRLLFEGLPRSLFATLVLAVVLAGMLWGHVGTQRLGAWLAIVGAVSAFRVGLQRRWLAGAQRAAPEARSWLLRLRAGALLAGLAWGSTALLVFPPGLPQQLFLGFVIGGVCSGGVLGMYPDRWSSTTFVVASLLPVALRLAVEGGPERLAMAGLGLFFVSVLSSTAWRSERHLRENYALRTEAAAQRETAIGQARRDELTGLPNELQAIEKINEAIERRAARDEVFALFLLQIRDHDRIVASLGPESGDQVIIEVGRLISGSIGAEGLVARVSPARFLVMLPLAAAAAEAVARRIVRAMRTDVICEDVPTALDAHVGVCAWPEHGNSPRELLRCLHTALFDARERGAATAIYESGRDEDHRRQLALLADLRRAIHRDELELHYQPRVDLRSLQVLGLEALVRWKHASLGPIPPNEFVQLAERTGAIGQLTGWIVRSTIDQMRHWREQGFDPEVSVNLSAVDMQDPDLPDLILSALQKAGVPGSRLILEVTETTLMIDTDKASQMMSHLGHYGIRFSIDDFGTGFSSLAQLKRLPVDELKIDRSFVSGLQSDSDDVFIVRSTIDLGHKLGVTVTAEGVETPQSMRLLLDLGCDHAQGYAISGPLPAARVREVVEAMNRGATEDHSRTQRVLALTGTLPGLRR
jgi:diguanylate cyclase (GGDEF)-like protein